MFYIDLETDFDKRYDMAKFLDYQNSEFDILNSYWVYKLRALQPYSAFVVTAEENRPELVSYKVYGDTQYWWVILMYNGLLNYEELPAGTVLKYPLLSALEDLYFSLKSLETS